MKTALQELIELLEENGSIIYNKGVGVHFLVPAQFINKAKSFIEKEKQQIIDAYINGRVEIDEEGYSDKIKHFAENYYEFTFKNE